MTTPCVVFDVDDTLYLERDYVRSGFEAVGRWASVHLGLDGVGSAAWEAFCAGRRRTIFDDVLTAQGVRDPEVVAAMVDVYRRHRPTIALEPDARQCLDELRGRAVLAVVTDGPRHSQRAKVSALGLPGRTSLVVVTEELGPGRGKPHPLAFEVVEARTGVRAEACTYVADNPTKDFAAPRALGWRTVRVRRPGSLHEGTESGDDVDVEVEDLGCALAVRS